MKLSYSFPTLENPFWRQVTAGLRSRAQADRVSVQLLSANDLVDKQVRDLEGLVADKPDVVALSPCSVKGVMPVLRQLAAAGIPVVAIDQNLGDAATANVTSGNMAGGIALGNFLVKKLGSSGQVVVLQAQEDLQSTSIRRRCFVNTVTRGGMMVVASLPAEGSRQTARTQMQSFLRDNKPFNAVFAENDNMALGAISALQESSRGAWPLVLGYDAIEEAVEALREGKMAATIRQKPEEMGAEALATAVRIFEGQPFESTTNILTELVTEDNVDRFFPRKG